VILLTRWNKRFFGSRMHNRISTDVTFINTSTIFLRWSIPRRMTKHPIGALSLSQLYFSCLPTPSPSSFFYWSPLSKPVIAIGKYGVEYTNVNNAPSRGIAYRALLPLNSILSGALSRASKLRCRGETRKKKKERKRSTGQSERATPVTSKPRRRCAEKYAR